MKRPDFASTDIGRLSDADLKFLIEHFPVPGRSYEEIARVIHQLPSTVESMLGSRYVLAKLFEDRERILQISPFLLFSVLLRQVITERNNALERSVINYLANMLSLFARTDRLFRAHPEDPRACEHLIDLVEEGLDADSRRQFIIHAHIGNYALYLTGLFPRWLEHRHRYRKRPTPPRYYSDMGRSYFQQASSHPLAAEYRLDRVFLRLALLFEVYQAALNRLASRYLAGSPS